MKQGKFCKIKGFSLSHKSMIVIVYLIHNSILYYFLIYDLYNRKSCWVGKLMYGTWYINFFDYFFLSVHFYGRLLSLSNLTIDFMIIAKLKSAIIFSNIHNLQYRGHTTSHSVKCGKIINFRLFLAWWS